MRKNFVIVGAVIVVVVLASALWVSKTRVADDARMEIFLTNAALAGEGNECEAVYPLHRTVAATNTPEDALRVAVAALLDGPGDDEIAQGYATSIPSDARLRTVQVNEYAGVVTLDFSEELQAGGSCRVTAIRQQIEATVAAVIADWYPSTFGVVITVNGGSPDEALQP